MGKNLKHALRIVYYSIFNGVILFLLYPIVVSIFPSAVSAGHIIPVLSIWQSFSAVFLIGTFIDFIEKCLEM